MVARGRDREPERTCIGCRQVRGKPALVRLVKAPDGSVAIDPTGSAPGRGAYVCRDQRCIDRALPRLPAALRAERMDVEQVRLDLSGRGAR